MIKYIGVIFSIFGLDLTIKNHVEENKEMGEEKEAAGGRLILRRFHNKGAFLHLGEKRPVIVKILSVLLSLGVTVLFLLSFGTKGNRLLRAGYSLLLGGAYNNTYDRLKRGYVVDYFSFNVPGSRLKGIVFNISDFCILIGAMIVCISSC